MRNKILLLLLLVLSVPGSSLFAQSAGINFMAGLPMGEFKDNVDRAGWGVSGHFLFLPITKENPFSIGLNVGYLNYGSESRREPFSETIPDVTVDVDRTNNLVNFHVVFQAAWPTGSLRPYIEGLFGGSYLFTETSIKSRGVEEVASSTNFDDFAWSYGGGGGFMIRLTSNPDEQISSIYLDLKARYLAGSKAEYLREGSVIIRNGRATYQVIESKTDLLTIHAGVVIEFNSLFN
jgi:hypothetical protein